MDKNLNNNSHHNNDATEFANNYNQGNLTEDTVGSVNVEIDTNSELNKNDKVEEEGNEFDQDNRYGKEDVTNFSGSASYKENSLIAEKEGLDFLSQNLLIKDSVESVSKSEIEAILRFPVSERYYNSVLSFNQEIKNGGTGLTYYQLFDRMLSKSIYLDAVKIGLTLKNKSVLRSILYNVLDAIPKRVGRRNQGYLKDNMMISRIDVHTNIRSAVFKFFKNKSKNKDYRHGLSAILEVTLLSQFIYFDLIDNSEFDNRNLLSIRDNLIQDIDFDSVKNQCVIRQIKKIVTSTLSTAGKLSSYAESDSSNSDKSVDFSTIIDMCIKEFDDIADSLLTFNSDYADFDTLLVLARIYRDRRLFIQVPDFRLFTEEVTTFVESNFTLFDIILTNVQFNDFMDKITVYEANKIKSKYTNQIAIKKERWLYLMTELRNSLLDSKQPIRLYNKNEFMNLFTIDISKNNHNKPYHVFLRRNVSGNHFAKLSEILSQESDFQKDVVNVMSGQTNSITLFNDKHYGGQDFENLVYTIIDYQVRAAEAAYIYGVKMQLPQYTDFCIHQYAVLLPHDIKNLVSLNSSKVIKFFEFFSSDLLSLIPGYDEDIQLLIKEVSSCYRDLPIYVAEYKNFVEHADRKQILNGTNVLYTRLSSRIIEQIESHSGTESLRMLDNLISKGKYYVSQRYQLNDIWRDFVVLPDDKFIEFELPSIRTTDGAILPALRLKYDLYHILQPVSNFTETVMPTSNYRNLCMNYIKSLFFFINSNNSITYGYSSGDLESDDRMIYNKDVLRSLSALADQSFTLGYKTNIVNWPSIVSSISAIFELQLSYIQANEAGRPLAFAEGKGSHIVALGIPKEIDKSIIFNHYKDVFKARALGQRYCTFSSVFVSFLKKLYDVNVLYKSIVDNSLASSRLNTGKHLINDIIDVNSIMNSGLENNVLGYYLKRALLHVAVFVDTLTSVTGDLKNRLNADEDKLREVIEQLFTNKLGVLNTLYTITEIYSMDKINIDNIVNRFNSNSEYIALIKNSFFAVNANVYKYENEIISSISNVEDNVAETTMSNEHAEKISNRTNLKK